MRHIKRYEECETHSTSTPIKVTHPIFLKEDHVPYPSEEAEDRSYEEQEALERQVSKVYREHIAETVRELAADAVSDAFTELLKEAH